MPERKAPLPWVKVGATVCVASGRLDRPQPVTIERVGRRWAYFAEAGYRFDIRTGEIDGGDYSSPGSVFESEQAWRDHIDWAHACSAFHRAMTYCRIPPAVSVAKLRDICETVEAGELFDSSLAEIRERHERARR